MTLKPHLLAWVSLGLSLLPGGRADAATAPAWKVGTPIVTYCLGPGFPGGPLMDDAAAAQLAEGGWNLVWCDAKDLDVAQRHGLRAMVINQRLLTPAALPAPKELDALVESVKQHPALYGYYLTDEPKADEFPALGKLVAAEAIAAVHLIHRRRVIYRVHRAAAEEAELVRDAGQVLPILRHVRAALAMLFESKR